MKTLSLYLVLMICMSANLFAEDAKTIQEPTIKNVHYGPHERHVLDLYQAQSDKPTPVLVCIHGGGWLHGNKEEEARIVRNTITLMLKNGISVAVINYRFTTEAILPAPVYDAARAIQFLRYKAKEYNLDKAHFAATGGSAGGCTTLWLATHDDLADPQADDPVLRESTRLCGAMAGLPQTTLEPAMIRAWIGEFGLSHMMIRQAGGFKSVQEMDANYAFKADLYREFSPVNHLSKDDPPTLIQCHKALDNMEDGIHHAMFGFQFTFKARQLGVPCYLGLRKHPDIFPGDPSKEDFLLSVLLDRPLPESN